MAPTSPATRRTITTARKTGLTPQFLGILPFETSLSERVRQKKQRLFEHCASNDKAGGRKISCVYMKKPNNVGVPPGFIPCKPLNNPVANPVFRIAPQCSQDMQRTQTSRSQVLQPVQLKLRLNPVDRLLPQGTSQAAMVVKNPRAERWDTFSIFCGYQRILA